MDNRYDFLNKIDDSLLTSRQLEIVNLIRAGFNQSEIAKKLDIRQSTISKAIFGTKVGDRYHGGALSKYNKMLDRNNLVITEIEQTINKLSRLIGKDEKIQVLIEEIRKLKCI